MQKFTNEEQQIIMAKVNNANFCEHTKTLLELACGAFAPQCPCGCGLVSQNGEIIYTFHGDSESKDKEAKELVEKEINESGLATATFEAYPQQPGKYQVGYIVKVNFTPLAIHQ